MVGCFFASSSPSLAARLVVGCSFTISSVAEKPPHSFVLRRLSANRMPPQSVLGSVAISFAIERVHLPPFTLLSCRRACPARKITFLFLHFRVYASFLAIEVVLLRLFRKSRSHLSRTCFVAPPQYAPSWHILIHANHHYRSGADLVAIICTKRVSHNYPKSNTPRLPTQTATAAPCVCVFD